MSANVRFALHDTLSSSSSSQRQQQQAQQPQGTSTRRVILPYDVLVNLQGRRVTVLLTVRDEELEGTLRGIDVDRGDVLLDDVVHYAWLASADERSSSSNGAAAPAVACSGGGVRRELRRCRAAVVSSRYVALITPTIFASSSSSTDA